MKKITPCMQLTVSECGICCVMMISKYYGYDNSMKFFQELIPANRGGISLFEMEQILNSLNFDTEVKKTTDISLLKDKVPIIVHTKKNHFAIVEKITDKKIRIIDPSVGRRTIDTKDFFQEFSGYLIISKPNDFFTKKVKSNDEFRHFRTILAKQKILLLTVVLISIISYIMTLTVPFLMQQFIDNTQNLNITNPVLTPIFLIGLAVLFLGISYLKSILVIELANRYDKELMAYTMKHLLKVKYDFFVERGVGDLTYRLNLIPQIRQILSNGLIQGVIDLGAVMLLIIYILNISVVAGLMCMIILIIMGGFIFVLNKKISEINQREMETNTRMNNIIIEIIYNIFSVKSMGLEKMMISEFNQVHINQIKNTKKREVLLGANSSFLGTIRMILPFLIFVFLLSNWGQSYSLGILISIYTLVGFLFGNGISLFENLTSISLVKNMLIRVNDILEEQPESFNGEITIDSINKIEMQNASYYYDKRKNYGIEDISLSAKSGDTVAIVGKSGCGKSTISKVISGLAKCENGVIKINDYSIDEIDISSYKQRIGIVPQDISLFNKSILENIRMNDSIITEERVIEALKLSEIFDDISIMPLGIHTVISDMGNNFSGGQRQRLAIARALVRKPDVLIMDEATSNLDSVIEKRIYKNLKDKGFIKIIIAHRISTIEDADEILLIDNGKLKAKGTSSDLYEKENLYRALYNGA